VDAFLRSNKNIRLLEQDKVLQRSEAFKELTQDLDENGQQIFSTTSLSQPRIAQFFAAVVTDDDNSACCEMMKDLRETNGVIGAVDAQVIVPAASEEEDSTAATVVYLKNLRVDEGARRQGVASALVEEVVGFARNISFGQTENEDMAPSLQQKAAMIELHVDTVAARRLYEKRGFELRELIEGDGRMVLEL